MTECTPFERRSRIARRRAALAQQIAQIEQEKSELNDQLLRRLAEFDNYRRRTEREKSEIADAVAGEVVKPLLAILDDFERALKVECASADYARGNRGKHVLVRRADGAVREDLAGVAQAQGIQDAPDALHHR